MSRFVRFFTAAALAGSAIILPGRAFAQVPSVMTFTTTFPFMVGNTLLPAGHYVVRPVSDDLNVMELSNRVGKASVIFDVEPSAPRHEPTDSQVTFKEYGDHYVLKSIWDASDESGVATFLTRGEQHEMRRAGVTTPSETTVAAAIVSRR